MTLKTVRMALLFDFYGQLLTPRQQEFFALYYGDDLSLGEIAEHYGVSRQAVYDILRRSESALEAYDGKLRLVERELAQHRLLAEIESDLQKVIEMVQAGADAPAIVDLLSQTRRKLATASKVDEGRRDDV